MFSRATTRSDPTATSAMTRSSSEESGGLASRRYMSMARWNVWPPSTEAAMSASASGSCSWSILILLAARRDGRYQATHGDQEDGDDRADTGDC